HGREGLGLYRRPHQGHDPVQWLQRVSARHRGSHLRAPLGGGGGGHRGGRSLARPVAKAFIKLRSGAPRLSFEELQRFIEGRLGQHERLSAMELRDALPRTPVGKLSKKDLVEEERARAKAS